MKKLSKLLALLLAVAMMLSLAACGSSGGDADTAAPADDQQSEEPAADDAAAENDTAAEETGEEAAPVADTSYKVAMITDSGDITDQSFNQTTYETCKAFCETYGIEFQYYKPDGDTTEARVAKVDAAVADGYNIIVMPGYLFGATIVEESGLYPDVKFVALDVAAGDILEAGVGADYDYNPDNWDVTEYYNADNVFCAIYQEELSGYMAGYAAVKMGYQHLGFLGGMSVPAVNRFGYGYVQGADAAAVELGIADQVTVEFVYGGLFYGDPDFTAYMDNWYQTLGVEVVFACGGGIYTSAAEAAAKANGKVIGVDSDQAPIIDQYAEGMTVTSAMKGLANTVDLLLSEIILNNNWDAYKGQILNLGMVSGDDPTQNYVQLPMDSTQWNDGFTQDDYKALVAKMYSGEITVSNDTTAMPETTITVNDYGKIK